MPASRVSIAADLGGTKLTVALVSADGRIHRRTTEPVSQSSREAPAAQIVRLADALAPASHRQIFSVGVAVPGLVRRDGAVWAPNLKGWDKFPLGRWLARRMGAPVVVESDRNACVLGEAWRGAAKGKQDVVVLMIGTGIGAGILSGGRLVRGAHELSGCAGWLAFANRSSKLAKRCGQLEAVAAGPAVARLAGLESAAEAARAARCGDRRAQRAFDEAGTQLGLAVANLISLFDPEVIVLTGGLTEAAYLFLSRLRRTALEHAQPLAARAVKITLSRLGGDANLLGAAHLAFEAAARKWQEGM